MGNRENKSFRVEWVNSQNNPVRSNKIKEENIQKNQSKGKKSNKKNDK